ncbi:MAG: ABC transporter ATP-binding protein [Lachnospiraceae bacterium]|nr:ABC transporter ATP-binding protein [Lachnospiraceae bacterium]
MLIELTKISKRYGSGETEVEALKDIDLRVNKKEFVAVMGKSGCGKTTLINILGTIIKPDTGRYMFDGNDITKYSEKKLATLKRSSISIVFQSFNLVDELDIKNNIILPFIFDKKEYDKDYLESIIKDLEIKDILNKYPDEVSGGEKQRVAIARALLVKPQLILADEPTGNLDSENSEKVVRLLKKCVDDYGSTVIMVTHDIDMTELADRILEMSDGKMIKGE